MMQKTQPCCQFEFGDMSDIRMLKAAFGLMVCAITLLAATSADGQITSPRKVSPPYRATPPTALTVPAVAAPVPEKTSGPLNVPFPTKGGKQFWTDEAMIQNWRVQRHSWSGHYRLLDASNIRRAWGSKEHCLAELERFKKMKSLKPVSGKVVIALHGLCRSRDSMTPISNHLNEAGYTVFNLTYASSRGEVAEHAKALAEVVNSLTDATEINFVAHSLGNLVIRHYFADATAGGKLIDARIKRVVMIAPPNQGARIAEIFKSNQIFKVVWGRSGSQIAEWKKLSAKLATPPCEFGIIAGGQGEDGLSNPLLTGDDDGIVRVKEAKLPGARDFILVPTIHGIIMNDKRTLEYAKRFFEEGHFVSAEKRSPIPTVARP